MAKKPRHLNAKPYRQTVLLDSATMPALDAIAPGNMSEAVRWCIQYALARGALEAATTQHTTQQRADYLANHYQPPAPLPQSHAGHPAPATPAAPPLYSNPEPPVVETPTSRQSPAPADAGRPTPAQILAYAKTYCTDDDIEAARRELLELEATARAARAN